MKHHITMDEILSAVSAHLESKGLKIDGKYEYGLRNLQTGNWDDAYLHIESKHFKECEPVSIKSLTKEIAKLKEKVRSKNTRAMADAILSKSNPEEAESILLGVEIDKLKSIVKSTLNMSDVFFDEPVEVRKLILRELEQL